MNGRVVPVSVLLAVGPANAGQRYKRHFADHSLHRLISMHPWGRRSIAPHYGGASLIVYQGEPLGRLRHRDNQPLIVVRVLTAADTHYPDALADRESY